MYGYNIKLNLIGGLYPLPKVHCSNYPKCTVVITHTSFFMNYIQTATEQFYGSVKHRL